MLSTQLVWYMIFFIACGIAAWKAALYDLMVCSAVGFLTVLLTQVIEIRRYREIKRIKETTPP